MVRTVLLLLVALAVDGVVAQEKVVSASKAWVKAPAAGETTATAFVVVDNPTMYDVYLVSGKCESAGKVELISADKPVANITVPAYGSAELKPGAAFVRMSELKREVKAGDQLNVTLETDGGVAIAIAAIVK